MDEERTLFRAHNFEVNERESGLIFKLSRNHGNTVEETYMHLHPIPALASDHVCNIHESTEESRSLRIEGHVG